MKILVDTGSAVTIIRCDIWDTIGQKQMETSFCAVFAANGDEINLSGQGDVCIFGLVICQLSIMFWWLSVLGSGQTILYCMVV